MSGANYWHAQSVELRARAAELERVLRLCLPWLALNPSPELWREATKLLGRNDDERYEVALEVIQEDGREIACLKAEVERLQAIVARLPVDASGRVIVPGRDAVELWLPHPNGPIQMGDDADIEAVRGLLADAGELPETPRCPDCGYTEEDAREYGDHGLCGGKIPLKKGPA